MQLRYYKLIPALLAVLMLAASCAKEAERDVKTYYGVLRVNTIQFDDAPDMDVVYGDTKLLPLKPSEASLTTVGSFIAEEKKHLRLYKLGTDQLLVDTLISLEKGKDTELRFGYSPSLGFNGFVDKSDVPQDSVKLRWVYNAKVYPNPYDEIELHILDLSLQNVVEVITGLKKGDINGRVMAMGIDPDYNTVPSFFFKIKDAATGQFIKVKDTEEDLILIFGGSDQYAGCYLYGFIDFGDLTQNWIAPPIAIF